MVCSRETYSNTNIFSITIAGLEYLYIGNSLQLLLWNSTSGNKPWPWIPLNEKVEPPNIVVLSVAG